MPTKNVIVLDAQKDGNWGIISQWTVSQMFFQQGPALCILEFGPENKSALLQTLLPMAAVSVVKEAGKSSCEHVEAIRVNAVFVWYVGILHGHFGL